MKQKNCPACGQSIQITPAMAGTTIRCPHCKHGLKVPPRATPTSPPGSTNSELTYNDSQHNDSQHNDAQQNDMPAAGPPVIVDVHKSTSVNVERYRKRQNSRRLAVSAAVCIICCIVAAAIMYSIFTSTKRPTSQRVATTPLHFTAAKDRASLQMPKLPASWVGPARYFRQGNLLFVYAGLNPDLVEKLTKVLGEPLESSTGNSTASTIKALETSESESTAVSVAAGMFTRY